MPLELKKVINTELLDISVSRQADSIRARVENSHGILKDCFQQSVVQLAQAFDPEVDGSDIFPDFTAKLEQSVRCATGLARLIKALREFQSAPRRGRGRSDEGGDLRLLRPQHEVPDVPRLVGLRAVLHRDPEVRSLPALQQIAHRFETFLMTLFREVQKRSILQNCPADDARTSQAVEAGRPERPGRSSANLLDSAAR